MKQLKQLSLLLVLSWLSITNVYTQGKSEIAIGLGGSVYFGDMDSGNVISDLLQVSPAVQLRYRYRHSPYFATNVNFLAGKLKGDDSRSEDAGRLNRNLDFYSPLYELAVIEEIHVLGKGDFPDKKKFSPYLALGVAGYYFNPKTTASDGKVYELQPLGTEGQGAPGFDKKYERLKIGIPFGGGLKYKINERYGLSFELMSRYTFTDYLDDLSTSYAPESVLLENGGPIAVELADRRIVPNNDKLIRGDEKDLDYYFTYMLNFHIALNKNRISGIEDPTIK